MTNIDISTKDIVLTKELQEIYDKHKWDINKDLLKFTLHLFKPDDEHPMEFILKALQEILDHIINNYPDQLDRDKELIIQLEMMWIQLVD